jgi:hypothetical protein
MKHIIIILIFGILADLTLYGQTENPDTKTPSKEEKKALRKAQKEEEKRKLTENLEKMKVLAENRSWVIEAHTVFEKGGRSFQMNPTINFVSVLEEEVTIQLSFNGIAGWNGVGGITLEGKIQKYQLQESKNSFNISMTAMGSALGPVDLLATISPSGNGRVTISGNWGDRITFAGDYVAYGESTVYKGTPTY